MIKVLDARFLTTAVAEEQYPAPERSEIAFVGRSNVGKSSMINALLGRRKLVRVSNTPGRTRTINFFDVEVEAGEQRYDLRMADLPGYGFAKASKGERKTWDEMISGYLEKRDALKLVVSIVDAEVGPTRDDLSTLTYLTQIAKQILVVATKIDRIPKAKRKPRMAEVIRELELPVAAVVPFSATDKIGVDEVWETLLAHMAATPAPSN